MEPLTALTLVQACRSCSGCRCQRRRGVHHVGRSLWDGLPEPLPDWLDELEPAMLVALSAGADKDVPALVTPPKRLASEGSMSSRCCPRRASCVPSPMACASRSASRTARCCGRPVLSWPPAPGDPHAAVCAGVPTLLVPRASAPFLVAEAAVAASMAVRVLQEELYAECLGAAQTGRSPIRGWMSRQQQQ